MFYSSSNENDQLADGLHEIKLEFRFFPIGSKGLG